jgi:hypothetical protein
MASIKIDDNGYGNCSFGGCNSYNKNGKEYTIKFLGYRYLLKAIKLMLTLFKISSIAINMVIRFLLVNKPNMPIKNKAVLTNKICSNGTACIIVPPSFQVL